MPPGELWVLLGDGDSALLGCYPVAPSPVEGQEAVTVGPGFEI